MRKLSVAEVAELRKTGRVAAYRWLLRNASKLLVREGRYVVISADDYAKVSGRPLHAEVDRRLADLEALTREQSRRLDKHAEALARVHLL